MEFSSFFEYPALDEKTGADDLAFLADCSEEEWDKVLAQTQRRPFSATDVIVDEGNADRALYIVAN